MPLSPQPPGFVVEMLTPEWEEAYEAHLGRCEQPLIFYALKYRDFLTSLLGCEAEYLIARDAESVHGILPLMRFETPEGRIYNSMPYYCGNGGILADGEAAAQALAEAYRARASAPGTLAATLITHPHHAHPPVPHQFEEERTGLLTPLPRADERLEDWAARLEPAARRNVRKASGEGLTAEVDHGAMEALRRMHVENMAVIGARPKSEAFFTTLPQHFTPGQDYDVWVARREGEAIAAMLVFYCHGTVDYFVSAIQAEHRSSQPLSLLVWSAMEAASRRGYRWWNWGGTRPGQEGVYRFKRKWTPVESSYHIFTQLNAPSLLEQSPQALAARFAEAYVVPFSALRGSGTSATAR